jgi:pimeloyl-ACP methyl ester carboxylesterase
LNIDRLPNFIAGLALACACVLAQAASEEAITLDTPTGKIAGTLAMPAAATGRVPVVLIIAGSGPTDRDGNSKGLPGANNSLKLLAQSLADAGFASVRYDKRGVAASLPAGPRESELRFDMYVDDAAAWVDMVKRDARFSSVAVIGHSEGSLIGMVAAQKLPVGAFVSLAGIASGAADVLRQQMSGKLPPDLAADNERILVALEHGQLADPVPPALQGLYRPSVQPYIVSWFKYVPAQQFARLKMPVLIAQGDTDIQVQVSEAEGLKKAKPDAQLVIVPGMNHVLKLDSTRGVASYSDPSLPIAPALIDAIVGFLRGAHLK